MTSIKLQKIDQSLIKEHSCLELKDHCYFLGEYESKKGYQHSPMNQLINNFKKPMERKSRPEWRYKEHTITEIATLLLSTTTWPKLKQCTWIPMPPSKLKTHPEYDDRLLQVLYKMRDQAGPLDIREIFTAKENREAAHLAAKRLSVAQHLNNLVMDESQLQPTPQIITIFDDMITSGAGFKAAQILLRKRFPDTIIAGIFVARNKRQVEEIK